MASNQEHFEPRVSVDAGVDADVLDLLYDPQTSGGLLLALDPAEAPAIIARLAAARVPADTIGEVVAAQSSGPLVLIR